MTKQLVLVTPMTTSPPFEVLVKEVSNTLREYTIVQQVFDCPDKRHLKFSMENTISVFAHPRSPHV